MQLYRDAVIVLLFFFCWDYCSPDVQGNLDNGFLKIKSLYDYNTNRKSYRANQMQQSDDQKCPKSYLT